MRQLTIYIFGLFALVACRQTNTIQPDNVESILLIQVNHPYLGERVDSIKLDKTLIADFLSDFDEKKEAVTKFYSCYVIKIHLKDGQLISYRTNGNLFEKFKDDKTTVTYFKLNKDINLVTKYWGIQPEKFCSSQQITLDDLKGNWYQNKWTLYHTLEFSDKTVFVDNHIDSVFTVNYSVSNDTLISWDNESTVKYKANILAITKDTLVLKGFSGSADTLRYSRTKRKWDHL